MSVFSPPSPASRPTRAGLAVLALAAACASSGQGAAAADGSSLARPTTRVSGQNGVRMLEVRTVTEDPTRTTDVGAPPDSVWAALTPVYTALKIPFDTYLSTERRLGTAGHRVRGRFAGIQLGRVVNCGTAASGGDNADLYEVLLDVTSTASPGTGGTTALRTSVSGTAQSSTTAGEPINCVTTGALERIIAEAVRARVESVAPPR